MAARVLLLYNPLAGRVVSSNVVNRLSEMLFEAGLTPETCRVDPRSLPKLSLFSKKDLVVVFGGDGTLHHLLPVLIRARLPVGLIPGGTANVLAREVGIPTRGRQSIEVLSRGKVQPIYLGTAEGRPFLLMAGVGVDGYLLLRVPDSLKRFLGIAAFWITGAVHFWSCPLPDFRVATRTERFSATLAIISKCRYYGRHLRMAPQASVFEPSLDVCLFLSKSHLRFIGYLWAVMLGRHTSLRDVVYRKADAVWAEGLEETYVQLDGEPAGTLPRCFRLSPDRLNLIVP